MAKFSFYIIFITAFQAVFAANYREIKNMVNVVQKKCDLLEDMTENIQNNNNAQDQDKRSLIIQANNFATLIQDTAKKITQTAQRNKYEAQTKFQEFSNNLSKSANGIHKSTQASFDMFQNQFMSHIRNVAEEVDKIKRLIYEPLEKRRICEMKRLARKRTCDVNRRMKQVTSRMSVDLQNLVIDSEESSNCMDHLAEHFASVMNEIAGRVKKGGSKLDSKTKKMFNEHAKAINAAAADLKANCNSNFEDQTEGLKDRLPAAVKAIANAVRSISLTVNSSNVKDEKTRVSLQTLMNDATSSVETLETKLEGVTHKNEEKEPHCKNTTNTLIR